MRMEGHVYESYAKLLLDMIVIYKHKPEPGKITLIVWENKEHLHGWIDHKPSQKDVRVLKAPLALFPMVKIPEENKDENPSVMGIALGSKEDYSDAHLIFYITLGDTNPQ